jgi:hypothetical protein
VNDAERERQASRRLWAAIMLARDLDTCASVLRGLPVRSGNLDPVVLHHALRGRALPPADTYLPVTAAMLDAIAEVEAALAKQAGGR